MQLVEVFKTDIKTEHQAKKIVTLISQQFPSYTATCDLDDCDNILRITTTENELNAHAVIRFLNDTGTHAEILSDEIPPLRAGERMLPTH